MTSKSCYGAVGAALTAAHYDQSEILHRESLRRIPGLPKHTRMYESYRFAQPPQLRAIITDRSEGHSRRRAATRAGLLVYNLGPFRADLLPVHLTTVTAPWEGVLVRARKPASHLNGREHHQQERAAGAASADLGEGTLFRTLRAHWRELMAKCARLAPFIFPSRRARAAHTFKLFSSLQRTWMRPTAQT